MPVVVLGLNHRTSAVALREKLAFPDADLAAALARLRETGAAEEAVIVSTCNRVELYAAAEVPGSQTLVALRTFLRDWHTPSQPLDTQLYALNEPDSLCHLFRVVCGLDSMVLGETEVLGQVKKAYDWALHHHHTGRRLNKVFQHAFHVAKQVRTQTHIQRGNISVGSVAVDLAERIFTSLEGRTVMVVGAGDTSEKTARALISRGARHLLVTNRSFDRAVALATTLGGTAVPFEDWSRDFARVDIVISSTSASGYVIDRARLEPLMQARHHRPLLLVDIAVPRDIDPEVNRTENVFLSNIDDLRAIADDALRQRQEEVARCEKIIDQKVLGLLGASVGLPAPASRNALPSTSRSTA